MPKVELISFILAFASILSSQACIIFILVLKPERLSFVLKYSATSSSFFSVSSLELSSSLFKNNLIIFQNRTKGKTNIFKIIKYLLSNIFFIKSGDFDVIIFMIFSLSVFQKESFTGVKLI